MKTQLTRATLMLSFGLASALIGCQSQGDSQSRATTQSSQASEAAYSQRTPDGDNLNGPIPYGHWPYDIARGGGGGTSGR